MKRTKKVTFTIAVIIIVLGVALFSLAPHPPAISKAIIDKPEMEAFFERLTDSGSPPGLSVVVVKGGQMIYCRGFGKADAPRNVAATHETVYHWWSMTKIPTAIAILQLQEKGSLNIEDDVTKYLPWFDVRYPSANCRTISIRNLLQHSSGLPDPVPAMVGWVHADDALRNQTELIRKVLPTVISITWCSGLPSK